MLNDFKPQTYDIAAQTKALQSFETTAVRTRTISGTDTNAMCVPLWRGSCFYVQVKQAEQSATKIEAELKDLKETLKNIEGARPFDQLTVADVIAARPEIAKTVEEMVKKGKWSLPGYEEKFGSMYP